MKDILVYFLLGLAALGLGLSVASNLDFAKLCLDEESAELVSYLYSQTAKSGSLVEEANGDYTLTLREISDATVVFTDRPIRDAFAVTTADFVARFAASFGDDPPNAALSFVPADGNVASTAVFTIDDPIYDGQARTLTYRAVDIPLSGTALTQLPGQFGEASLFIDPMIPGPAPDPDFAPLPLSERSLGVNVHPAVSGVTVTIKLGFPAVSLTGVTDCSGHVDIRYPQVSDSSTIESGYMNCSYGGKTINVLPEGDQRFFDPFLDFNISALSIYPIASQQFAVHVDPPTKDVTVTITLDTTPNVVLEAVTDSGGSVVLPYTDSKLPSATIQCSVEGLTRQVLSGASSSWVCGPITVDINDLLDEWAEQDFEG